MNNVKKIISPILTVISAVFVGFMGLFSVIANQDIGLDGFFLLNYSDALRVIIGIVAILGSVLGFLSLIFVGYNIYKKKENYIWVHISATILSLVYMVLSIIVLNQYLKFSGALVYTLAYVPFIILVIVDASYIFFDKMFSRKTTIVDNVEKVVDKKVPYSVKKEHEAIELIKEYKELLDSGIITQEEFDAKKAQLL